MAIFVIFALSLYYLTFYKEITNSWYILLMIFIVKLVSLVNYYYTDNYIGLTDDYIYWVIAKALLMYTPDQLLLSKSIGAIFMIAGGFHIVFNVINYLIYYYFGDNIMNMVLFNLIIFILCAFLVKKISEYVFISYKERLILCFVFLLYPDLWVYNFFNLKDYVVMLLVLIQILATFKFCEARLTRTKIAFLLIICISLFLIIFLRVYAVVLYLFAVLSWHISNKQNYSMKKIQWLFLIIFILRPTGFYDFAISPFFLNVSPIYAFMQWPSFINWFFLYPIVIMGIIQVIKDKNKNFKLILFYLNYTFLFYATIGYSKGLSGPRQRIFIEFIYVFLIVFGIKFLSINTNLTKKIKDWVYDAR